MRGAARFGAPAPAPVLVVALAAAAMGALVGQAAAENSTWAWRARRAAAARAAFGPGGLPSRDEPDAVHAGVAPGVDAIEWRMQLTPPAASAVGVKEIVSTVFYSPVPDRPSSSRTPRSRSAYVFHHGHNDCNCSNVTPHGAPPAELARCRPGCTSELAPRGGTWWDLYNVSSFLHAHGHDVFIVSMPLKGVNKGPGSNATHAQDDHWWFLPIERAGEPALRYFLEPAIATINYARRLGYEEVHMAGLSGGGWTTTVVAALDARVASSFPIAGSIPCALRDPEKQTWPVGNDKEDFEQNCAPDPSIEAPDHPGRQLYRECNYTCMYLLAGLESTRYQVQILHERDDCCYATVGRHDQMLAYESNVRAELGARAEHGYFTTTASNHTHHEVAPVDKAIWTAGMRAAQLPPGDPGWDALQCDIMHNAEGACSVRPPTGGAPPPLRARVAGGSGGRSRGGEQAVAVTTT